MDRHGLLSIVRKVAVAMREKQAGLAFNPEWRWAKDMIICPEIPCFACKAVCKTNIVMVYDNREGTLKGQFSVTPGGKAYLGLPFHTHAHGITGSVCLGRAKDLQQLLLSPPTPHASWEWDVKMVKWYHIYAQHDCEPMHKWWKQSFGTHPYPWSGPFAHKLEAPIRKSRWEVYGDDNAFAEVRKQAEEEVQKRLEQPNTIIGTIGLPPPTNMTRILTTATTTTLIREDT